MSEVHTHPPANEPDPAPVANARLKAFVERIERLNDEEAAIKADRKEVFSEAKGEGFSVPAPRALVARRAMDRAARLEKQAIVDLYASAIGEA